MNRNKKGLTQAIFFGLATISPSLYAFETLLWEDSDAPVISFGSPVTSEQYLSRGAYQIHADYAWLNNFRGQNVVVGVIDSGLNLASNEFNGRVLKGYNAFNGSSDVTDKMGHGTHVTGIIGAALDSKGMIGVAPNVSILPIKVFGTGSTSSTVINNALNWSIGKTRIVNLSFGSPSQMNSTQFQKNIAAGQLLIAAAGNEGQKNPGWPARFAKESWAKGQIIAVGAVDSNNKIASFSNKAGDTKYFYVVAPGVNITSTYPGAALHGWTGSYANYGNMSGTSMATPYVTGLAASIAGRWSQLKANQIAQIIFSSADRLGSATQTRPDDVYGWGLVNAEKAFAPVGTVSTPINHKLAVPISSSSGIVAFRAAGDSLGRAAQLGNFQMIALDEFGRDYGYDMGASINTPSATIPLGQIFSAMDTRLRLVEAVLPGSAFVSATTLEDPRDFNGQYHVTSFSYTKKFTDGSFSLGTSNFSNQYFGLSETPFVGSGFISNPMSNPFVNLALVSNYGALGQTLGNGWSIKGGMLFSLQRKERDQLPESFFGFTKSISQNQPPLQSLDNQLSIAELEKVSEKGKFTFSTTYLQEDAALLGGQSYGAFDIGRANTLGVSLAGAYNVRPDLWIAAQANYGTSNSSHGSGVISGTNEMRTMSTSLGLIKQSTFIKNDTLGFYVSQPLKVISGSLDMSVPVGVSADNEVLFQNRSVSLKPTATEINFEANYATRLSKTSSISGAMIYRHNPGHVQDASADAILALRWVKEL